MTAHAREYPPNVTASPMPPGPIEGPDAWLGKDLADSEEWVYALTSRDVDELSSALERVESDAIPLNEIGRAEFSLPTLGPKLDEMRGEILRGRGFVLVRGLPVERFTLEQSATAFWGIGAYLGQPVPQNAMGHLLGHVIDLGRDESDPSARIYQTNARQFYHADSCDIVGLLCLRTAKAGGSSTIVSSVTLYNALLARAPQLIEELFQPVHFDRREEVPPGQPPWYRMPIFNWHAGRLSTHYVRRYIVSARRFEGVPELTERQLACFDLLDELADDPDIHLSMDFEPGDIQFLHNPQILHDRTAYEDWPEPERRRHLLRLWLCAPDGRPLPAPYAGRWGRTEIGNRGGIVVAGQIPVAPLEP